MYRSETYNWNTPVALPFSTIYWQYFLPCPSKITPSPSKARQKENTKIQFCLFSWHLIVLLLGRKCADWGWGTCLWYPGVVEWECLIMSLTTNMSRTQSVTDGRIWFLILSLLCTEIDLLQSSKIQHTPSHSSSSMAWFGTNPVEKGPKFQE